MRVTLMGEPFAACSMTLLLDTTGRNISAQITTLSFNTNGSKIVDINKYHWKKHCRGLFELPIAA
jgi:hypothetical protein